MYTHVCVCVFICVSICLFLCLYVFDSVTRCHRPGALWRKLFLDVAGTQTTKIKASTD